MKFLNIASIHSEKFPYRKSSMTAEERTLIHNLILNLNITHINQVWTTDITYISTKYDGTLFLISFMDLFSRKIVGWTLAKTQKTVDVEIALRDAIKKENLSQVSLFILIKALNFVQNYIEKFLLKIIFYIVILN